MKIIPINIQSKYIPFILSNKKTAEGRLNKGKFAKIKVGDILEINKEKMQVKVIEKNVYPNFKEMIEKEGVANVMPDKNNIQDAVSAYYEFYTKEQEKEFGVVAIKIKSCT
ncbi:MAG: ASCH domain-containing protein [Candidatus Falkowbacteria bacterium]